LIQNYLFENNLFAGLHLVNSTSTIENTTFKNHTARYSSLGLGGYSAGLYLENSNPSLSNCYFEKNYYGIYVKSGDCPATSSVSFWENIVDIGP